LVNYVRPGDASHETSERATRMVVERFASHDCSFLRVIQPAESDIAVVDESIIDIGHEALIRRWDKLGGKGEQDWIREEQEDAEQYRGLLRYAETGSTIPLKDLIQVEDWWSKRNPSSFWARRYSKRGADYFEKVRKLRAQSRAEADGAIESHKRFASQVLGILAHSLQKPREFYGAADSLAICG
jgi:hypothetical protein